MALKTAAFCFDLRPHFLPSAEYRSEDEEIRGLEQQQKEGAF